MLIRSKNMQDDEKNLKGTQGLEEINIFQTNSYMSGLNKSGYFKLKTLIILCLN